MKQVAFTRHGILRGMDAASKSNTSEGRFGRMFRTLPKADFSQDVLIKLGDEMVSEKMTHQRRKMRIQGMTKKIRAFMQDILI